MRIRRISGEGEFENPLYCMRCGAKLPVEVQRLIGEARIAVYCKKCKTVTYFNIEG